MRRAINHSGDEAGSPGNDGRAHPGRRRGLCRLGAGLCSRGRGLRRLQCMQPILHLLVVYRHPLTPFVAGLTAAAYPRGQRSHIGCTRGGTPFEGFA